MAKLKITSGIGRVETVHRGNGDYHLKVMGDTESVCNITTRDDERSKGNAELITDVITTYNKCGLLSSELLADRNQLIGIANGMMDVFKQEGLIKDIAFYRELLSKYNG